MPARRAGQGSWLVAIVWILSAPACSASQAQPVPATPEIARADPATARTPEGQWALLRSDPGLDTFRGAHGGRWRVRWNEATRTPHRAFGSRIPAGVLVDGAAAPRHAEDVRALAEAFVRAEAEFLGVQWEDLRPLRLEWRGGRWIVLMQQWSGGVEVVGGRVDLRFTSQGDLVLFGSDAYTAPARWSAGLDADAAVRAALQGMPAGAVPHARAPEPVFLPMLGARPGTNGPLKATRPPEPIHEGLRVRPAYRLHLKTTDPPGDWETYVDAETGAVLWRFNRVRFANGMLHGDVHPDRGTAALESLPYRDATIFCGAVADTVASYDFESGASGWSAQTPWALSSESVHGGTRAWSDSPGANYADYRDLSLTSPKIDLKDVEEPVLVFWVRHELEDTWDFLYVEGSGDNGGTWKRLHALSGSAAWHSERVDLSPFADSHNLRLRFRLVSDGAVNSGGCWIDDVVVAQLGSTVSAADGSFSVGATGGDSTLVTSMRGPYAQVINRAVGSTAAALAVQPGAELTHLDWNAANSRANERDTFYGLNAAHARLRDIDPGFAALEQPLPVFVGIPFCNAYYGGGQIVMGSGDSGCADFGQWTAVVAHEYGHAVTDLVYGAAGDPPSDMHEAFSDYFAATLSGDPRIGIDIQGLGTMFRSIDNRLRTPEDASGEAHIDGTILAGALWDLRALLAPDVDLADSLFHFARYGAPKSFEDYYLELLGVDDDDGNLGNGTPHLMAIRSAFGGHGIGTGPEFEHVQVSVQDAPGNGDGRLDAGETADLGLVLRNYGGAETDVSATLTTQVPGVLILVDSLYIGNVAAGAQVTAAALFRVQVGPEVPVGTAILFDLQVRSSQGANGDCFMLPVGYVPILLVDDDRTLAFETWLAASLDRLGQRFLRWEAGVLGSPTAEEMATYRAVVWMTGNDRRNTLTPADQEELIAYLGAGGRLFLTGEDIGEDLWKGTGGVPSAADKAFYENWLRAKVNVESEGAPAVSGVAGDPLSAGLAFGLNGGTSANNLNSCSSLVAVNGSVECMRYSNGRTAALRYAGAYRLLYTGFGFEGVSTVAQRDTLMARALRWLCPAEATPPSVTVLTPNGGDRLIGQSSYTIQWTASDAVAVTSVDLFLSTDGGATFTPIATGLPNSFTYAWDVVDTSTDACVVRVEAHDPSGNTGSDTSDAPFTITALTSTPAGLLPQRFALHPPAPNPFNPATRLSFDLPFPERVWLEILAVDGTRVRTLVAGDALPAGTLHRLWDGRDERGQSVPSGVFFVRLRTAADVATRKIQLLR